MDYTSRQFFLYTYLIILLFCCITGILSNYFTKPLPLYIRLMPWFMVFILIIEIFGIYLPLKTHYVPYNLYVLGAFYFYSFVLCSIIQSTRVKRLYRYAIVIFSITVMIALIRKGIFQYHLVNFYSATFLLALLSGISLREHLTRSHTINIFTEPSFWITSGILLVHGCQIPLIIPAYFYFYTSMFEVNIVMTLVNIVNCIAYSMFLFALLRPFLFREQKKQLPPEE